MIPGIVAGQLNKRLVVEGLVPLGLDSDTDYYRFIDKTSITYGPSALQQVPTLDTLRTWKVEQVGNELILSNSSNSYVLENNITDQLANLSLTFDQNGYPMVVWEVNKTLFLRWYDPVLGSITVSNLGYGYAPFIALETFNDRLKTNRNIFIVFIDSDGNLSHKLQSDRYTVNYLIKENVKDIIGFGPTDFNSLKIVYVNDKNVQGDYVIGTVGTERLGLYEFDLLNASEMSGVLNSIEYNDTRYINSFSESSPIYTVTDTTTGMSAIQYYRYTIDDLVESSPVYTVSNTVVSMSAAMKGYKKLYPVDSVGDITVTGEILSLSIKNAAIPVFSNEYSIDVNVAGIIQALTVTVGDPVASAYIYPLTWNNFDMGTGLSLSSDKYTVYTNASASTPNNSLVKSVLPFRRSYVRSASIEITEQGATPSCVGIVTDTTNTNITNISQKWMYWSDGRLNSQGTLTTVWPTYTTGDIIQIVYDTVGGGVWLLKNGVSLNGDPVSLTDPLFYLSNFTYKTFASPSEGSKIKLVEMDKLYSGVVMEPVLWENARTNGTNLPTFSADLLTARLFGQTSEAHGTNIRCKNFIEYSQEQIVFTSNINMQGSWYDNDFSDAGFSILFFTNTTELVPTYATSWCYNRPTACYSQSNSLGPIIELRLSRQSNQPTQIRIEHSTGGSSPLVKLITKDQTSLPTTLYDGTHELTYELIRNSTTKHLIVRFLYDGNLGWEEDIDYTSLLINGDLPFGNGSLWTRFHNYNQNNLNTYVELTESFIKPLITQ